MANYVALALLLTAVALSATTNVAPFTAGSPAPANSPRPTTSPQRQSLPVSVHPPPLPLAHIKRKQFWTIVDAIIGAEDFSSWADIISVLTTSSSIAAAASLIPTAATVFVPGNTALAHLRTTAGGALSVDPFLIPYHILPERLTFSELRLLRTQTRLPTLLPSRTVVITNDTPSHFTIDDSLITHPDLYATSAVCVHGVDALLDYTIYGSDGPIRVPPPPLPAPVDATLTLPPELGRKDTSMGVNLGTDFLILWIAVLYHLECLKHTDA